MTSTAVAGIGWKQLNGRKTVHRLHPAMLGDGGHLKELEVQPVPKNGSYPKAVYSVLFDRSYAIEKLSFELGKCGDVPFLDLVELMAEAYAIVNPDAPIVGIMAEISSAVKEVVSFDPLALSGSWEIYS